MNPTLREFDVLEIVPYGERMIQVGDVIFFKSPANEQFIVHRVSKITQEGIHTRGDNNPADDPYLLHRHDIEGQIIAAWRGGKQQRVLGGVVGYLLWQLNRVRCSCTHYIVAHLRPFYHSLAESGIVCRLLPFHFQFRIVNFQTNGSSSLRLLLGKRVVGWYDHEREQWQIRRPFRIFVDEQFLP
jgi:signal peptidase I